MSSITEKELWDDFSYYQTQTAHYKKRRKENPYIKVMKPTRERLELMRSVREWCEGKGLPVRQWLFSLFAIRRWLYAPKLTLGHLCSENHLQKFATFSDYRLFNQRLQEQAAANPIQNSNFDPNRDISHSAEDAKKRYKAIGAEATCMTQTEAETFGYHPKSSICEECKQKKDCSNRLRASVSFDILALRQGQITAEQAYRQALAQVGGYGN